jgi:hypothetical protein
LRIELYLKRQRFVQDRPPTARVVGDVDKDCLLYDAATPDLKTSPKPNGNYLSGAYR